MKYLKNHPLCLALLGSLLIHSLIFSLFIYIVPSDDSPKMAKDDKIFVEYMPGSSEKAAPFKRKERPLRLSDLMPIPGSGKASSERQKIDSSSDQKSQGMNFLKESKHLSLYQYVYNMIDGHLNYPTELSKRKIQGTVSTEIFFSKEGKHLLRRLHIDSASRYLRVLVSKTLRKALALNVPKNLIRFDNDFRLKGTFKFEITEHDSPSITASSKMIRSNHLIFYRNFPRSILQWEIGPLSGVGPLPTLDLLWFPRKLKQFFSRKKKIDPLMKYRHDPAW